jgi:hypothetical protein
MLPQTLGLAAGRSARPRGPLCELKCCCARGFYHVLVSLFSLEGLFKCPARGFYGFPFVLTVICMGFKALLSESLFECSVRAFYDVLLLIAVICMGFKASPSYFCHARGFCSLFVVLAVICIGFKAFPSWYCSLRGL